MYAVQLELELELDEPSFRRFEVDGVLKIRLISPYI
jgi:hypothetical protein